MKEYPLVSIVIPTYRRASFLSRAVNSALMQTYPNIEVLVVDDNDPDTEYRKQTHQIMERYANNSRVHYIKHPRNLNGAAARNTGMAAATGKWCCFLDDDDWYLPEKIERQVQYLDGNDEYQAVYCGYKRADKTVHPYKQGDLSFELLSGIEVIYTNTIMIERVRALEFGGWDERFKRNQEAVFLLRYFSSGGKIGALSDVLVQFDISDASNRSSPEQFEKDFEFFLDVHQKNIERCTEQYPNAKEKIFSYRYRGILLNYIKNGCWKQAIQLYKKISMQLPGCFSQDCITYIIRRILHQPLFKEFN